MWPPRDRAPPFKATQIGKIGVLMGMASSSDEADEVDGADSLLLVYIS